MSGVTVMNSNDVERLSEHCLGKGKQEVHPVLERERYIIHKHDI